MTGGIQAASMEHNVVMTPGKPLYFDHYQFNPDEEPVAIGGFNSLMPMSMHSIQLPACRPNTTGTF